MSDTFRTDFEKAVLTALRQQGGLVIGALVEAVEHQGVKASGDRTLLLAPNLVAHIGVSSEAIAAFNVMLENELIKFVASDMLAAAHDGSPIPDLPLAGRNPPAGGYRKPRWMPTEVLLTTKGRELARSKGWGF